MRRHELRHGSCPPYVFFFFLSPLFLLVATPGLGSEANTSIIISHVLIGFSQEWIDVEIILSGADPTYIDTLGLAGGATASMSTSDGGTTWNVGTINIPAFTF